MKRSIACSLVLMGLTTIPTSGALLANGGFEDPVTSEGMVFVGSWEAFSGGVGAQAVNSIVFPRTGAQNLSLSIANVNNTFAGVFQDIPGLTPGTPVNFSGYHLTANDPLGPVAEFRIEWRNSVSNTEVTRTLGVVPPLTPQYAPFSLDSVVPPGADTARVVYALQSFEGTTDTGTVFVDDVSFAVPEPSVGVMALAALGWAGLRRRR